MTVDRDVMLRYVVKELDTYLTEEKIVVPEERYAGLARQVAVSVEVLAGFLADSAKKNRLHHGLVRAIGRAAADAAAEEVRLEMVLIQHGGRA